MCVLSAAANLARGGPAACTLLRYDDCVRVSLQYAEAHFNGLLAAVDRGEEVFITRPGKHDLQLMLETVVPASNLGRGAAATN